MQTRRRLYLIEVVDPEEALRALGQAEEDGHDADLFYLPRSRRFAVAAYLRPAPLRPGIFRTWREAGRQWGRLLLAGALTWAVLLGLGLPLLFK